MNRFTTACAAAATSLFLFAASGTPAFAQSGAAYRLVPAAALTSASTVVTGETLWKCGAEACVASKATARPAIVCAQAAKKVGKIVSFTAKGETFTEEQLAKCNEKAR